MFMVRELFLYLKKGIIRSEIIDRKIVYYTEMNDFY